MVVDNTPLIIADITQKNNFIALCQFEETIYDHIKQGDVNSWKPMERLLCDSDAQQLVYVIEVDDQWQYIRFPLQLWSEIDNILAKEQDVLLVISRTDDGQVHKSIPLKSFHKEGVELIKNMRDNANYGEEVTKLVEEHFQQTIESFSS